MIDLPLSNRLSINRLSSVFGDTTNSYKFYWFLAILDELYEVNNQQIRIERLYRRMIEYVWYPLSYYKLSFGKSDGFKLIADQVNELLNNKVDNSINSKPILSQIEASPDENKKKALYASMKSLARWVPYRFIRPFFAEKLLGEKDTNVNGLIRDLANQSSKSNPGYCIYHFEGDFIIVNDLWADYLKQNYKVVTTFIYWNLVKFLQRNNPTVIGLSEKIFKPSQRELTRNNKSWNVYFEIAGPVNCIYSGQPMNRIGSLDHYVPWSYTVHDLNWNLVPVSKQLNSSKSDCLPDNKYLEPFVRLQHDFFKKIASRNECKDVIEDYVSLFGLDKSHLLSLPLEVFEHKLLNTIGPMIDKAADMGFVNGWVAK